MKDNLDNGLAKRSELHLKRRIWHVTVGAICLFCFYFFKMNIKVWAWTSLLIGFIGFAIDFLRLKNPKLNTYLTKRFGPLMRRSESLSFSGLPFYALGVALSIFLYKEEIAVLSILYLIFADPIASIVGVYLGKDRLLPNKTLQGTVASFGMCLFVGFIYISSLDIHHPNTIMLIFLGAIAGALSELLSAFNVDDNLTIPVLSGALLTAFNLLFKVF